MQTQAKGGRALATLATLTVGAVLILAIWYSVGSTRVEGRYWPLLILALCPLMHIFMHRSHGDHRQADSR